jgi:hypothetical protein
LQVKTCRFAEAEKGFDAVLSEYEPLTRAVDRAIADPATRRALAERLLAADETHPIDTKDTDGAIASMLQVDARFFRLHAVARGLSREAADVDHVEDAWSQLEKRIFSQKVQTVTGSALDAPLLLERVNALGDEIARARRDAHKSDEARKALALLEGRRAELAGTLERMIGARDDGAAAAERKGLLGLVQADRVAAGALRGKAATLAWRIDAASGELIKEALTDLRVRLDGMLRQARLGKIDAVVGQKRKLERQIEDLAAGRFPAEMFGKLHIEGLIRDDEEYWPPEPERWADEYENYK